MCVQGQPNCEGRFALNEGFVIRGATDQIESLRGVLLRTGPAAED